MIDLQAQTLFGKPVLTWWQGRISGIVPSNLPAGLSLGGSYVIYNQHYKEIMAVKAPNGVGLDLHELQITPQGNAFFITTRPVKADLTAFGGPRNGTIEDPIVQGINLRTMKPVFSWNMAAHVPLSDSMVPLPTTPGQSWDAYHANSVDVSPDGSQVLVSARDTWGIYDVSSRTGQILWQIGGKQNQFTFPSGLVTGPFNSAFQYQHDARFTAGGISLFDNAGLAAPPYGGPYGPSRGLILNLNIQNHTASLASPPFYHDPALYSNSQGDLQILPNGNVFIGWGSDSLPGGQLSSYYTEYSSTGTVLADYSLAAQDISYRALSQPWVGVPLTKPSAYVASASGQVTAYASWNGSTQTASWRLLAGRTRGSLTAVVTVPRTGFETTITTTAVGPFYAVQALGPFGGVLNTSEIQRAHVS